MFLSFQNVIRADASPPFIIGPKTNIQDYVLIHCHPGLTLRMNEEQADALPKVPESYLSSNPSIVDYYYRLEILPQLYTFVCLIEFQKKRTAHVGFFQSLQKRSFFIFHRKRKETAEIVEWVT
ncbi:hypothetical protein ACFO25_15675 [Paenactinomyces guangxiensis]|uniref:Uncharacterized protein n=1 Tax=Paenactinomyces guangxiensis TaxID=1490290 RepID=A0A7W2A8X1_9BACL|nr:hypothetical protein [Paenactinomyces guangxiensis]MBA4496021.1 hypothetical protein [Paenactinomyces guangxiensis]MBH8593103.1 hypothetical protein [Paenactinomyces guangxiensis]